MATVKKDDKSIAEAPKETPKKKKVTPSKAEKERLKLQEQLEEKEQEIKVLNDRYLRLAAEFDNYRKRREKEFSEIVTYAGESVLRNILPVLDDIERALKHGSGAASGQSLRDGLELIYKKFMKVLKDFGVEPIEALEKPFDPDLHHAMMTRELEGTQADLVVEEFEKGYKFKEHVLRHSKVVVSK